MTNPGFSADMHVIEETMMEFAKSLDANETCIILISFISLVLIASKAITRLKAIAVITQ